jgi:hypothetical protein
VRYLHPADMQASQGTPRTPPQTPEQAVEQAIQQALQAAQAGQLAQQGLLGQDASVAFNTPSDILQAARAARQELQNQQSRLQSDRYSIAQRLRQGGVDGADLKGLESRLVGLDQRIAQLDKQIADQDAAVAKAASVPGAVTQEPRFQRNGPPEEVVALTALFFFVVLMPLSIAYARRIWRKSAALILMKPQELNERFTRLEQSLDSIAVEVERVGEGQRFLTRVQAQQQERALGAGAAERVEVGEREAVRRK